MKQHQTLRRGLSILLSLVLCLSLLPATALAEGSEIKICGTTLEEGKAYAPNDGGIAEKTDETNYLEYNAGELTVHGSVTVALPASSTANVLKLESGDLTISCPEGSSLTLDGQNSAAAVSLQSSTLTLTGAGDVTIQGSETAVSGGTLGGTLKAESYSGDLAISAAGNSATVNHTVLNLDTTGNISITGSMPVAEGLLTVTNAADVTITGSVGNLLPYGSVITDTGSISIESESSMVVNGLTVNNAEKVTLTGNTTSPVAMSVTLNGCESWDIINKSQTSAAPLAINITVDGTTYGNCYGVTVTADGNGTASASLPVASAGTNITLSATANEGYRFKEWEVVSGSVTISGDNKFTMPGANVTVKAIFEEDAPSTTTYTVSFDANGGSGEMTDVTDVSGSYTLPTTTTFTPPEGKQFAGWATSADGEVITGTTITVTEDTTLYAVWEDIPATTCDKTADFTTDAEAALALLNAAKTEGAANSEWDPATSTLTLKGVNFTTTAETAVKLPDGATIVLADGTENTIASTADNAYMSYGIYATNGLTIEGSGTLTVRSAKATTNLSNSEIYGIYADAGDITISGGTVTATAGEAEYSSGIYADGAVTITGGTVTATGGTAEYSCGIDADGVTISGGTVTATGGKAATNSRGIDAYTNVTISGGTVTATGGETTHDSWGSNGIDADGVTISGGTVTATGGKAAANSCGIYAYTNVTITGGTLTVTAGTAEQISCGIYGYTNVTITGGTVTATGGEAEYSCGIDSDGVTISGGTVTATGGKAATNSYGIYAINNVTISGGHVTAQTVSTTATTESALNVAPDLSSYTGYYWRTSSDGDFTNSTDTPYTFDGSHTYVEFDSGAAVTTSVEINAENFPDETFRKYVSDNFDTDTEKGVLSPAEIEAVTSIDCPNMGITDLKGIEHFTELTILSCSQNQLKELDVSKNTKLYGLNCSENQLKALDVSKNAELVVLTCSKNQLETLSVSGNAKLNSLNCSENQLKKINVSGNTALETLECSDNMLTALVVSNNTALKVLRCAKNQLTTLNVAKNSILNTLDCSGNQLTALSVSSNAELNSLDCSENQLETLDVSSSTSLDQLRCSNNRLKVLDVSKNTGLRLLYCKENQLTSLDLSENGKITGCYAENNSYEIELTSGRTFDLSTLPGKFEVGKASGWTDSSVSGNTLTVNDGATKVTYIYNCENSITAKFTLTVKSGSGVANEVAIDEANFPDEKFRQYVRVYTDKDGNGALSTDEIAQAEKIYCSNRGIKDFTGIEHFTALTELYCDKNQLIALDVSSNTALEYLECSESQLTTLNIGSNTKLKSLICSKNQLTSLDVSGNTALKDLVCSENRLATPNLSINPALENLDCSKNQLTGLDLSGNAALKNLDCSGNQLTTLGFSDGAVLEKLICSDNRLATLNVSGSAKLTELHCGQNKLASLDVSKNTALEKLDCSGNQLTTLVVSSNTALTGLDCSKNNLTSLNLTGTQVNILYADDNTYPIKLTSGRIFDLSSLPGKFEVGNAGGWNGGSVSGNILTVNADATEVTYTYDCGHNNTETFTLTVQGGGEHTHSYGSDWKNDADNHWHECSCGDRTNIEEHTASNWITDTAATATTDGTKHKECTVCGYVMETGTIPATGGSSSSSSSGGGSSSTPTYVPSVTQPENGAVTVSPKAPKKGDTVTITPKPETGYTVEQILVTDKNGAPVKVTNNGDGTYSFTQPAGKVNVEVTFMEDNSMLNFFVDIPAGAYYYDAVLWAAENGITGGVDDTHFAPNAPCTRAQIVTFLWRAAGSPEPENVGSFADVSADSYYAKAVAWAVENGITTGTGDGMFSPDATCTRAQIVTFLWRSQASPAAGAVNPFTDVAGNAYYAEAVKWAVMEGVTSGTTATTFSPNDNCTRAQIVTFLWNRFGE